MLKSLSWDILDKPGDLIGWLIKCIDKDTKNFWYKVIMEETHNRLIGSYGNTEEEAIINLEIRTPISKIKNYIQIIPIRKIF